MELFQEAEFWIGVALVILIGVLVWVKVPGMALKALDARAEKIRAELAQAERLRQEAEALLAQMRERRDAGEKHAAEMLANAEAEAARLKVEAEARLKEQIRRRAEMAERRIVMAEQRAIAEVKAAAVEMAAEAAAKVLAVRLEGLKSDPLVDAAVADVGAKLQ